MPIARPPDIPVPPLSGKPGGLGQRLEDALVRFASRVLNGAKDLLAGVFRFGLGLFVEETETDLISIIRPFADQILSSPGVPDSIKGPLREAMTGTHQGGLVFVLGLVGMLTGGLFSGVVAPMGRVIEHEVDRVARSNLIDVNSMVMLWVRGRISEEELHVGLARHGINDRGIEVLKQVSRPLFSFDEMSRLLWRDRLTPGAVDTELEHYGYNPAQRGMLRDLMEMIPGPGDLIHMAVREAWNEGVASRYGYDEDYPAEFQAWMEKQGYSPGWSRRWWRSHWEVPGPTMAREMLHRTDMTEADYGTVLKIADYPPTFRKWMTEVAYEPYTRVDIRRMYQVGVITTYAELVRAYNDIGYDDEKASKLADFTVLEYGESEREATRAEVMAAYQIGRLSPAETRSFLDDMGYPGWVIEMYVARVDMARTVSLAKETISHVKTMYVSSQISKTDVYTTLGRIPLASTEIERYLEEWEIARTAKVARPSRADLLRFFLQNEMDEFEFRQELRGYRLSERYIDWYTADAKRKLVLQAQKEAQDAQDEAASVRARAEKTTYDIRAADIGVEIALLNLTIADIKASDTTEMTLEEVGDLSKVVIAAQLQIKALQLEKAQFWAEYLRTKEV